MNFARISKSLAIAGVSTAMAAGALVGVTTTSANAATANGDYTCTSPLGSLGTFAMQADALLPPSVTAGFPVVADLLGMTSTLTVPATVAPALASVTGGTVDDFAMTIGSKAVHVPLTVSSITPNPDQSVTITAAGKNQAFTVPAAGTYDVKLPQTFNFTPTGASGPLGFNVTCTSASPATLTSILITKQFSTIAVGKVAAVRKTQHAKVPVTVKNDFSTPTGKVVAKEGTKVLGSSTLKSGKAVISLIRLKPGRHTVTVTYTGDAYTKGVKSKAVIVKILR